MSVKLIGISQRLLENTSYFEIREALSADWGEFFKKHLEDFLPIPLSYAIPFSYYVKFSVLSGVILSGGNDLNTLNPNPLSQMRDLYEDAIIAECLQKRIPLLGICRGAQKIAEYFGSRLEQCVGHTQKHIVSSKEGEFWVNSYHNYCITHLGSDLERIDSAGDGSVESFLHKNAQVYGVMWHIEREGGMENTLLFEAWRELVRSWE
ncbi:gamma-glutamyl-CDP-amidate hydrolase [Helicobacter sp.]|uniref:gamma-glutamyl-CDP-amidate hydrolase n=1 Tax=Helicobacter sp. TaxID=218 RepID=UPI0025B8DA68|nr:gamma-glutamyl-CDP-amidate hydrolase [Helicobacter sp.]MCI5967960.1 gamma-glutamyl-gamma-aminobutyrate hydrolase family protein [Helicobacter sp.]MDY2585073.1 gamma-glutamyl-gamma-aminobutyrate hydrolase family protein [Helicobacter sp.]